MKFYSHSPYKRQHHLYSYTLSIWVLEGGKIKEVVLGNFYFVLNIITLFLFKTPI